MLFPGKKCHNSGHQPVASGIVAFFYFLFFFHFISNTVRIILAVPSKKASVMLHSSSPSLISLSISQSALLLFLMPLLLLLVYLLPFPFSKFLQFHTSAHYNLCIFLLLFFSMRVSNGHAGSISRHFLLFLSITVISGPLCSRVLSVCIGKSHKILHFSDSKTFSGFCMYHSSALLNPIFP